MKIKSLLLCVFMPLFLGVFGYIFLNFRIVKKEITTATLSLNKKKFSFVVANTINSRKQGLSLTKKIPKNGMLFVFENSNLYTFWMKDMSYPIDIVWLDSSFTVVYIIENVSPDTYPSQFSPKIPSMYVLEVESGFIQREHLKIGDMLPMEIINIKK